MAVKSVVVKLNGQDYTLEYNEGEAAYILQTNAPFETSYNQPGHYYPATLVATDTAGNVTTYDSEDETFGQALRLEVNEKTPPVIDITSPGSGAIIASDKPTITFTLDDEANGSGVNLDTLALKIDSGEPIGHNAAGMTCTPTETGYTCSYQVQTPLSAGSHVVTIDVQDNDENQAVQKSVTFTVDTSTPTLDVTYPTEGLETNQPEMTVQIKTNSSDMASVTLEMKLNDVDQGAITVESDGTANKAITLQEGQNTIYVKATAANGLFTEVTRHVTLDTVGPVVESIELIPNPVSVGGTLMIRVKVHD